MAVIYFIAVVASIVGLQITGDSFLPAVVALELSTIVSTLPFLLLFETMPIGSAQEHVLAKKISIICMASCMVLTSVVHTVQLTITQPFVASGNSLSTYFQVGFWPSVPMAIDYLAWGFFMGTTFLCSAYAVDKVLKLLKTTLLICGLLCYMGLLGVIFINENCWYLAPMGYGIGIVIVCIELLQLNKRKN